MWAGEGGRGRSREELMADNKGRWVHKVKKKSTWTIRFIYRQTDRWIDRLFRKTLTTPSWLWRLLFSSCLVSHIFLFLWFFLLIASLHFPSRLLAYSLSQLWWGPAELNRLQHGCTTQWGPLCLLCLFLFFCVPLLFRLVLPFFTLYNHALNSSVNKFAVTYANWSMAPSPAKFGCSSTE